MKKVKISVDTIREVTDKLSRRSQQQAAKVVYLQGVEQLTEAAANALLKTLEEPTEDSYFILQTNVEHRVLATIQSRCQQWALPLPTIPQGIDWLQQQGFSDVEQIKTALLMNYQRPFAAKISLEKGEIAQRLTFYGNSGNFIAIRMYLCCCLILKQNNQLHSLIGWKLFVGCFEMQFAY